MTSERQSLIIGLAISIVLSAVIDQGMAIARAGGAGFGRGNFGHAGFDRGDFDRGFDHYGSDMGDIHGFNNGYARPDSLEHVPAAAEDHTYNWGGHGLSTDNGLNKATAPITPSEGHGNVRDDYRNMADQGNLVRGAYGYHGVFNSGWWGAHPNAWRYDAWAHDYGWGWGATGWPVMAGWWGMPVDVAPVPYDYGNNITYQNDTVYYGTQPMESSVAYYQQAQTLAQSEPVPAPAKNHSTASKEWKPLGVFSLVQGGQTNTNMMFQLAVNKQGAIKGNYYNALTDETKPVIGAVDKKNMRAAWTVGNNKNVVYDTGVANLLKEQSPILVHLSKDKTQQWNLVRLQQPKKESS